LSSSQPVNKQETMNNSFISEIDMSFSIIPEKYLDLNFLPDITSKRSNNYKSKTPNIKNRKVQIAPNRNNNIVDNMILSHLSSNRKEFNSDRFKKIFERFDKLLNDMKNDIKES
jgi:hypothetical protein